MTDGDIMFIEEICEDDQDNAGCPKKQTCDDNLQAAESQIVIIPGQCIPADEMPERPSMEHLTLPDQCKSNKDCNYKKVCVPNWFVEGYECVDLCKAMRVIQKWVVRPPHSFKKYNECNLTIEPEATCPPKPQPPTDYVHDPTKENPQIMKFRYFIHKYSDPVAYCDISNEKSSDEEELSGCNISHCDCDCSVEDSGETLFFCQNDCASSFSSSKKCIFVDEPVREPMQTIEKKSMQSCSTDSVYRDTDEQCSDQCCDLCCCQCYEEPCSSTNYYTNCEISSCVVVQQPTTCTKEKSQVSFNQDCEQDIKDTSSEATPQDAEEACQPLPPKCVPQIEISECVEEKVSTAPITDTPAAAIAPTPQKAIEEPSPQTETVPEKQKKEKTASRISSKMKTNKVNDNDQRTSNSQEDDNSNDNKQADKKNKKYFNCPAALERLCRKMRRSGGQNMLPYHFDDDSNIFYCSRSNAAIDVQNLNYSDSGNLIFNSVVKSPMRSMTTQRIISKANTFKTFIEEPNMKTHCICCMKPKHICNKSITSTSTVMETLSSGRGISNNYIKSFQRKNSIERFYESWSKNSTYRR